ESGDSCPCTNPTYPLIRFCLIFAHLVALMLNLGNRSGASNQIGKTHSHSSLYSTSHILKSL
ncbi:MAG TPA: hypothetical protein PLB70_01850, partial [Paludibacteraceae bacterium]|nr:hypothetical protein [Paludibacteraceae bacterium]